MKMKKTILILVIISVVMSMSVSALTNYGPDWDNMNRKSGLLQSFDIVGGGLCDDKVASGGIGPGDEIYCSALAGVTGCIVQFWNIDPVSGAWTKLNNGNNIELMPGQSAKADNYPGVNSYGFWRCHEVKVLCGDWVELGCDGYEIKKKRTCDDGTVEYTSHTDASCYQTKNEEIYETVKEPVNKQRADFQITKLEIEKKELYQPGETVKAYVTVKNMDNFKDDTILTVGLYPKKHSIFQSFSVVESLPLAGCPQNEWETVLRVELGANEVDTIETMLQIADTTSIDHCQDGLPLVYADSMIPTATMSRANDVIDSHMTLSPVKVGEPKSTVIIPPVKEDNTVLFIMIGASVLVFILALIAFMVNKK